MEMDDDARFLLFCGGRMIEGLMSVKECRPLLYFINVQLDSVYLIYKFYDFIPQLKFLSVSRHRKFSFYSFLGFLVLFFHNMHYIILWAR